MKGLQLNVHCNRSEKDGKKCFSFVIRLCLHIIYGWKNALWILSNPITSQPNYSIVIVLPYPIWLAACFTLVCFFVSINPATQGVFRCSTFFSLFISLFPCIFHKLVQCIYMPYHLIQKFSLNSTHTMYLLDSNALTVSRLSNILAAFNARVYCFFLFFQSILSRYSR